VQSIIEKTEYFIWTYDARILLLNNVFFN